MRNICHYRDTDDLKRKDENEGKGRISVNGIYPVLTIDTKSGKCLSRTYENGPVKITSGFGNPHYILCFHDRK